MKQTSNRFWQTLEKNEPTKKKKRIFWNVLKLLIKLGLLTYKVLKFFWGDYDS